jgi:hypothetical protein
MALGVIAKHAEIYEHLNNIELNSEKNRKYKSSEFLRYCHDDNLKKNWTYLIIYLYLESYL